MTNKSASTNQNANEAIELAPSPRLALFICLIGLPFYPLSSWLTLVICAFGGFLLLQTYTLRIIFSKDALAVFQLGREIRRFPFKSWLAWRILFPKLPGILYFREEASPHLLPILFDRLALENQLRLRVGNLEKPQASTTEKPT